MMKKGLAWFLCMTLFMSVFPTSGFADGGSITWSGTVFSESVNDGTISNIIDLTLEGDTFAVSAASMVKDTHFTVSNVPDGLTVAIAGTSETTATVALSGTATAHATSDSISNLEIAFLDAAFTGGAANTLSGYSQLALQVQYYDEEAPTVATPDLTTTATANKVTIEWDAATDNRDDAEALQYKVFMSDTDNIGDSTDAEANGTVILDWTADITESEKTGLAANTTYYFNVLVKDTNGNVSAYTSRQQNTLRGAIAVLGGSGGTELFLGGNYIEIGISNWGDLGTEGNKPAGIRGTDGGEGGSGSTRVGMSADFDGYNNGHDKPIDYYLPGTMEERFVVGYKVGETTASQSNCAVRGVKQMPTVVTDESDTAAGVLKANVVSTWTDTMEITQVISFKENDKFYKNSVTIKNISGTNWDGARYMRTFDPDNTVFRGGNYDTDNTVTHTIGADEKAVVRAQTYADNDLIYQTFGSRAPIFFYSKDSSAVASVFGFANTNPYVADAYDTPRAKGDTLRADAGITITFDTGALAAGTSKTFIYYTSLDERDFSVVEQEINDDIAENEEEEEPETPPVSSGGGGGRDSDPEPTKVIVIVNGETQNAGTEVKTVDGGKSVITVQVDSDTIEKKIEEAEGADDNVIQIPVKDTASDVVRVELTGDIVKKLEDATFDVSVKRDNVEYIIPAEEMTIVSVAEKLGVPESELKDIKIEIQITKLPEDTVKKYEAIATANGGQLVFPPVSFEITAKATAADGTVSSVKVDRFSNYVERVMEIPAGVDPSKITTGIVFNADGTYEHVPTVVFQKDGKWYAKLNSLTNSNYSVLWNSVTVKSVEGHWSEKAVNDMASRLVITDTAGFLPDKAITRSEFADYIVKALGVYRKIAVMRAFPDVYDDDPHKEAIYLANSYGIIKGYPDGTFRGDGLITREEAMAMYVRAMAVANFIGKENERFMGFDDYTQVSEWAKEDVKSVLAARVFNGVSASSLAPKANLTHAEAITAIRNLLTESGLINR